MHAAKGHSLFLAFQCTNFRADWLHYAKLMTYLVPIMLSSFESPKVFLDASRSAWWGCTVNNIQHSVTTMGKLELCITRSKHCKVGPTRAIEKLAQCKKMDGNNCSANLILCAGVCCFPSTVQVFVVLRSNYIQRTPKPFNNWFVIACYLLRPFLSLPVSGHKDRKR